MRDYTCSLDVDGVVWNLNVTADVTRVSAGVYNVSLERAETSEGWVFPLNTLAADDTNLLIDKVLAEHMKNA